MVSLFFVDSFAVSRLVGALGREKELKNECCVSIETRFLEMLLLLDLVTLS